MDEPDHRPSVVPGEVRRHESEPRPEARWHVTRVRLLAGDITQVSVDAVVNAANSALAGGGGVDGAIHAAAGPSVMAELRERYDGCATGDAVVTAAGRLPARHVIHAVGPIWHGGDRDEARLLASAYRASLDHAHRLNAASMAFPAISCGVYGYPLAEAADVALGAVDGWLAAHPGNGIDDIVFVLRGAEVMAAFGEALD
ncbi:MAG TPA: macro domain-containing protein, partial [Candidatus Limnocylindrales bacterium]|nr:macro domain-containing protein [Candidatus Limnocylindrales bacterium]